MRVFVGGLIFGLILCLPPQPRSAMACLVTGMLAAFLLEWTGPRSVVEKLGILLSVSLIAWMAGPKAAAWTGLFAHVAHWLVAAAALAFYTRPRAD